MKIKVFTILMVLGTMLSGFSQSNLNNYKYIIVPKKFDFLKQENQYRLNELTKFLFEKNGFSALMEGENYPEDLVRNRCLALKSDVNSDSGLFKTKLFVELKDCNDQTVFTSKVGETREKEFQKAYTEALRNAFESFETVSYRYEPKKDEDIVVKQETPKISDEAAKEIQELKEEIETLKQGKTENIIPNVVVKTETVEPITEEASKSETDARLISNTDILYAQETESGFQLVDSSPKVVYKIKPTSLNNVYFVEEKQAIIYKKGDSWVLEYYDNIKLKQEILNIKF